MNFLSPYAPTTVEEAEAYLRRIPATILERPQIVEAANAAVGWMEERTTRRLVARTYRTSASLTAFTLAANEKQVTRSAGGLTAGVKQFDDAIGISLSPGSRVESVDSDTALTLNLPATAASAVGGNALTFGSEPLILDGTGTRRIYLPEYPVIAVYSAAWIDAAGNRTALDITGARLDRSTGLLILVNDAFPRGASNIEIEAACGYRRPTATDRGDSVDWAALQRICHRLCQCYFQDWANAAGRVADKALGAANFRFTDFDAPKDVLDGINAYRRLW